MILVDRFKQDLVSVSHTERERECVVVMMRYLMPRSAAAYLHAPAVRKLSIGIDLKTAKTLNLTVPQSILARADEVIE